MKRAGETPVFDLLESALDRLQHKVGCSMVVRVEDGVRLVMRAAEGVRYHNAQLDDYSHGMSEQLHWRPPLRLRVRARFSHDQDRLRGTAGFGFWNDPFAMTQRTRTRLPRAIWFFFGSPPTNLPLAYGVPGAGWKAATLDAQRWEAVMLAPSVPLVVPLNRLPAIHRRLWPRVQRQLCIGEAILPVDLREWHVYVIEWGVGRSRFWVDERCVLDLPFAPGGPLGLVIWIDNQYMVATPQGQFGHGVVPTELQWLEIGALQIE